VSESDYLGKLLVEPKRTRIISSNGSHLVNVREPCPKVITRATKKDLDFSIQAPECRAVNDTGSVVLSQVETQSDTDEAARRITRLGE